MAPCPQMPKRLKHILDSSYCTFLKSLFATILSFADPITDILTLVEFYREDHKTWFAVGLAFVVLPCLAFIYLYVARYTEAEGQISRTEVGLCGFHPFSSAWLRLKICWKNFRICCGNDNSEDTDEYLLNHSELARFVEAGVESAPQFMIQLYAMSVQQESVKIIQMISLPVSFLSIVWASMSGDDYLFETKKQETIRKHKVLLFATYCFLLSSRLFAIVFFTVSYKWWMISVLMIHSLLIIIVDVCWAYRSDRRMRSGCRRNLLRDWLRDWRSRWLNAIRSTVLGSWLLWLRDDRLQMSQAFGFDGEELRQQYRRVQLFSNILFLIENCTMIFLFYFGPFSNTWYSLPVTVCVCSFSVIGAATRVAHFRFLFSETNKDGNSPAQQNDNNLSAAARVAHVRFSTKEMNKNADSPATQNDNILSVLTETPVVCSPHIAEIGNERRESTKGVSRFDLMTEYVSYV